MKPQVKPDHYGRRYDAKDRWLGYWYQADMTIRTKPESVLEVGAGNQAVSALLKRQGIAVTTVDIDPDLKPDIVASVTVLPVPSASFDTVLCAEVLEHLPFDQFALALVELKRVARKFVVLSLPHWGITLRLCFKLPLFPLVDVMFKIPWFRRHHFDGQHYWEIGKAGYPTARIRQIIKDVGFTIADDRVHPDDPAHHFFMLSVNPPS